MSGVYLIVNIMTLETKELFTKVNYLISKRKEELLNRLPVIHEVDDAIIIRFFTEWDNCNENEDIKFKKISNLDNSKETIIFFYLPKGSYFEFKKRNFIKTLTCLNGKLEIDSENGIRMVSANSKIHLDSNVFEGRALENTYVLTTN